MLYEDVILIYNENTIFFFFSLFFLINPSVKPGKFIDRVNLNYKYNRVEMKSHLSKVEIGYKKES